MGAAMRKYSLDQYQQPAHVFCPIGYAQWQTVLEPEAGVKLNDHSYAIHLWNERWRSAGQDKNAVYPEHSLYEKLKRKYLGSHIGAVARP
jgi:hypothetical protein